MTKSEQDQYYFTTEGDHFFERNFQNKNLPELRENKKTILHNIKKTGLEFKSLLEFGCCYADLLNYFHSKEGKEVYGVEASEKAIRFSEERYNKAFPIYHGTIAENALQNEKWQGFFDFILVDDVFSWVSRETLFQSIANINYLLKDGGYLYIRDFYPDKKIKNKNHHAPEDAQIYNFKVPGSHASIFCSSGIYEPVFQEIYYDKIGMSTSYKSSDAFIYRWTDTILKKSNLDYFNEVKKD